MSLTEAEQRRAAALGTAVAVPALTGAVLLTLGLGERLTSWARDWPGGAAGFTVTLALASAVSLLVLAATCLMYAWPERTPDRLRLPARARTVCAVLAGLVACFASVPLAMTLRRPGARELGCDPNELFCYLHTEEPGAMPVWIGVFLTVCLLGSLGLYFLLARPRAAARLR
ncbi:hypothetical protein [Streptomyces sp. YIM 98790]|uniref:hypothetical protein n=1 Tax=Streptomyces sp. YIM 98790 TaxID=2689077 RepID=UPI00140DA6FC|nr:hypothetical protein [Streptomyces sp. YIM 98790]